MYETLIGVLFSAGAVGAYLLTAKVIGRERLTRWRTERRQPRLSCSRHRELPPRAMTTEELSRRFTER